ncbi:putative carboxylesterase 17 [Nymphaea thermarum]|nr:putative carboxylesterase 17 [Nymphaea thermarum]
MGILSLAEPALNKPGNKDQTRKLAAEITGLIKVYTDGHVDRFPVISEVPWSCAPEAGTISRDVTINKLTGLWARIYAPRQAAHHAKLPLVIYFHGGGFCLGSPAWKCYHEFLVKLASKANCLIVSVNYRLAPENRLPAAYEDGLSTVEWARRQALGETSSENSWWSTLCDFSRVFLAGDSAGANIAYNVVATLSGRAVKPLSLRGLILIQPFFGGEARLASERSNAERANTALSLAASDTFWQLALPVVGGTAANRNHPWCNPLAKSSQALHELHLPQSLVCISEMDVLRDRNLEFCAAMRRAGKKVDHVIYKGVGHAFQVLQDSPFSNSRAIEMITHVAAFVKK